MLVYTGAPRKSGINNWEVFKAHINGDKKIFHNLERIGEIARAMHHALSMADWKQVTKLIREEWKVPPICDGVVPFRAGQKIGWRME